MNTSSSEELQEYHHKRKSKHRLFIACTFLAMIVIVFVTMMIGNYTISFDRIIGLIMGTYNDTTDRYILFEVRIPRILCCVIVGAALSCAGLVMQSLFRNPMASPSVLGISSGAAFGASIAMAFGIGSIFGTFAVPAMAFVFCFITMIAVYMLARTKYGVSSVTLLLAGVAIGAFFNGLVSLLQYIVNEDVLSNIVYWTMGSFNSCGWKSFSMAVFPIALGILLMAICRKELNLISAGEDQASNMGVDVKKTRIILITATSLAVGGSVAISGVIGFVGLIVPHIFRMLVGPDHKLLIPLCVFGGASFMLIMDTMSKMGFSIPIPVGVLTSLLGAPFFIYIMRRRSRDVWE